MQPYLRRHVVFDRVCQHLLREIHQSKKSHRGGKEIADGSTGIQGLRLLVGVSASLDWIPDLHFHLNHIYWVQQTAAMMDLYISNATAIELDSSYSLLGSAMRFHGCSQLVLELHAAFLRLPRSLSITQGTFKLSPNYRGKRQAIMLTLAHTRRFVIESRIAMALDKKPRHKRLVQSRDALCCQIARTSHGRQRNQQRARDGRCAACGT